MWNINSICVYWYRSATPNKQQSFNNKTGKVEPSAQLLTEEKFTFQKPLKAIQDNCIPPDLVINLDQTPLCYFSPENIHSISKEANAYQLKGLMISDKLRLYLVWVQSESFYQCKLSMGGKRNKVCRNSTSQNYFQCHSWKITGPIPPNSSFSWISYFHTSKFILKEQNSLVIMDTFKIQDNDILKELYDQNFCEVVIVWHNLTNWHIC